MMITASKFSSAATTFFTVFTIAIGAAASSADTLEFKSKTCRKPADGRGCTAAGESCVKAPKGKYIAAESFGSLGSEGDYWKKNPRCGVSYSGQTIALNHPDIGTYTQAIELCSQTHIESGGGYDKIGKVAFVNCSYTVTLKDIPSQ